MVYVDSLRTAKWRYKKSCHLTADTEEELISFVLKLGLRKEWLQTSRKGVKHFDLSPRMRVKALKLGAVEK